MSDPAYKMQPAGHDAPAPRRNYADPDIRLKNALHKYLDLAVKIRDKEKYAPVHHSLFKCANSCVESIQATPAEAHGLLLAREFNEQEKEFAGLFVSAIYNKSDAQEIVYDLDVDVNDLAYELPEDKAFIHMGCGIEKYKAGRRERFGLEAKGILVEYRKSESCFSAYQSQISPTLTYGLDSCVQTGKICSPRALCVSVKDNLNVTGYEASCAGRISMGYETRDWKANSGTWYDLSLFDIYPIYATYPVYYGYYVFNNKKTYAVPEVRAYVDNLISQFGLGRDDYRIAVETVRKLGTRPHEKIRRDIVDILERSGDLVKLLREDGYNV